MRLSKVARSRIPAAGYDAEMAPCCHPLASPGTSLDLPLFFLTGLTVSLGHCLGMCGPLQTAFALRAKTRGKLASALVRYHVARITGYAVLGAALGLLGTVARFEVVAENVQAIVSLAAGVAMFIVAIGLTQVISWPERFMPQWPYSWLAQASGKDSGDLFLGFANGFLPCGAVSAVALSAVAAAHPGVGALLLLVYGAGTLPVLFTSGFAASRITLKWRQRFQVLGAVLVCVIALQLVLRGAAALEWLPHLTWRRLHVW